MPPRINGHEIREGASDSDADPRHRSLGPVRDKSLAQVACALRRRAQLAVTPATPTTRVRVEDVAGPQHDAGLLGLEDTIGAAHRLQPVPMRLAILAAGEAASTKFDAVAGGIGERRLARLDHEFELAARAAAMASVAATVRAKLVAAKVQRKTYLLHLEAAELDAAGGLPFARPWPTVSRRGTAAARPRLKQMPDERPAIARVDALHRQAKASTPTRHGAIGTGRRQGANDRLNDLLATVIGTQRHRRARPGANDGAFLDFQVQRPKGPIVLGDVRINQVGERHHRCRVGVGIGGVDEARHLRMAVTEVDAKVAAMLQDAGADRDIVGAVTVVVEECLALVAAILPGGDDGAHLPLRSVEHGRDGAMRDRRAELAEELPQAPFADACRADHRGQITAEIAGMAHIEYDHLVDVIAPATLLVKLEGRNAQAFLIDLGSAGVIGAVRGTADITLVRAVDRPEHQATIVKDRYKHREIGQVVATPVGIVEEIYIPWPNLLPEELMHGAGGEGQGADVDRHVLGLGDQASVGIAKCR